MDFWELFPICNVVDLQPSFGSSLPFWFLGGFYGWVFFWNSTAPAIVGSSSRHSSGRSFCGAAPEERVTVTLAKRLTLPPWRSVSAFGFGGAIGCFYLCKFPARGIWEPWCLWQHFTLLGLGSPVSFVCFLEFYSAWIFGVLRGVAVGRCFTAWPQGSASLCSPAGVHRCEALEERFSSPPALEERLTVRHSKIASAFGFLGLAHHLSFCGSPAQGLLGSSPRCGFLEPFTIWFLWRPFEVWLFPGMLKQPAVFGVLHCVAPEECITAQPLRIASAFCLWGVIGSFRLCIGPCQGAFGELSPVLVSGRPFRFVSFLEFSSRLALCESFVAQAQGSASQHGPQSRPSPWGPGGVLQLAALKESIPAQPSKTASAFGFLGIMHHF